LLVGKALLAASAGLLKKIIVALKLLFDCVFEGVPPTWIVV